MLGIKEAHIVNVALGKAHGIALTDAGLVYSFGINNKGQCGRDGLSVFSPPKPSASANCKFKFAIDAQLLKIEFYR